MIHVEHTTQIGQISFKTKLLMLSLCDDSDVRVLFKATITITGARADAIGQRTGERSKKAIFKSCT